MARDVARDWMWSEALAMLSRAERLHRDMDTGRYVSFEPTKKDRKAGGT